MSRFDVKTRSIGPLVWQLGWVAGVERSDPQLHWGLAFGSIPATHWLRKPKKRLSTYELDEPLLS